MNVEMTFKFSREEIEVIHMALEELYYGHPLKAEKEEIARNIKDELSKFINKN